MVSRIQNRNSGHSENLFTRNSLLENNTFGSIDGATALKLDDSYQLNEELNDSVNNFENNLDENLIDKSLKTDQNLNNIPTGVSIESASYIENNNLEEDEFNQNSIKDDEEEYSPKLFSEEQNFLSEEASHIADKEDSTDSDRLFDQEINEEDDFEIPAFLRKQKF